MLDYCVPKQVIRLPAVTCMLVNCPAAITISNSVSTKRLLATTGVRQITTLPADDQHVNELPGTNRAVVHQKSARVRNDLKLCSSEQRVK